MRDINIKDKGNCIGQKQALPRTIPGEFPDKTHIVSKLCKNDPCDVIKMKEIRGEVGKKTPKKEMDNPSFL